MGLSVACLLAKKGANIIIVARNEEKLKSALESISASASNPSAQRFHTISADLTSPTSCADVLSTATTWNNNQPPDIVWCCAGSSHPTLFIDTPTSKLSDQMDTNYFSTAYIAHAALRAWLNPIPSSSLSTKSPNASPPPSPPTTTPHHLVFTSSVVAFLPIIGYAPYSPCKAALRSLSDTLSQELLLYPSPSFPTVKIHTVFPGTIFTPGYDAENAVKPAVTKRLEEDDGGQTPEEVAMVSVNSLERGDELVTTGWIGWLLKGSMLGGSRRNGWGLGDLLAGWVGAGILGWVRWDMDGKVKKWGREHGTSGGVGT
ncbi:hypothetical protein MMC20_003491 [Loxospora ochrophaea]|nr:hypothetical protein [Loxospora ochrophaea]